jgi:hypothetical protein
VIRELLERKFLEGCLSEIEPALHKQEQLLAAGDPATAAFMDGQQVSLDDLRRALPALAQAGIALTASGTKPPPALFPHDAAASLLQSALQQEFEDRHPDLIRKTTAKSARSGPEPIADTELVPGALSQGPKRLFGKGDKWDWRFVGCKIAEGIRLLDRRRPLPDYAAMASIGDKARLTLVGDWGSGSARAKKVGLAMRQRLTGADAAGFDNHVIHLGDVYYSGWEREYDANFFPYWPVEPGENFGSWSLNGNHDMYSGGYGYFDHLLADNRFKGQRRTSRFCLEHKNWRIVALDTGWTEGDLAGDQVKWAYDVLSAPPRRKGLLLTHHQPFGSVGEISPHLFEKLQPLVSAGLVNAWFWGHEHRCVVYGPHAGVDYASCVGHGGVEEWVWKQPDPQGVRYMSHEFVRRGREKTLLLGFAVLTLTSDSAVITYVKENGQDDRTEPTIAARV